MVNIGLFYAGYGAILTPAFGVAAAYGDDIQQYNNALGFFVIRKFNSSHMRTIVNY